MISKDIIRVALFVGCLQLCSCAYMQTHKNIEEAARIHTGYILTPAIELYRAGSTYYIAAEQHQLRKHYPIVHDSIFFEGNNEPTWQQVGIQRNTVYYTISNGTATVLQRADGFASLDVLSDEMRNHSESRIEALPSGALRCQVKADISGTSATWAENATPESLPLTTRLISTIDQVCIDWPGTLAYNVAIPVMAPFVFFHQFLNEE